MKIKEIIFLLSFLFVSCGKSREEIIRDKLGIPEDAKTVVIFQQSAHLDPDWLLTYDEYFERIVNRLLTRAIELMLQRKSYVYTIGELAFLKKYLEVHPDQREVIVSLIKNGQLKIIGGGFTTPDTNLPSLEAILMDYEGGRKWLRDNLLQPEITSAWLPDSFGHAPSLPDILQHLGIKSVAFSRIDGRTISLDYSLYETMGLLPLKYSPHSTAEYLINFSSSDFLWVGPGGGEVVAHWMIYNLYCLGGSIDSDIEIPQLNNVLKTGGVNKEMVIKRINYIVNLLKPFSRTGYIFVPVGCDFEMPKEGIDHYMRWWNEEMYPRTGTYAVLASFQEYGEILWEKREDLPVIPADLNPYFMGYYSSRPYIKDKARENLYLLLNAEALNIFCHFYSSGCPFNRDEMWWRNSFINHHDFITGTSPDTVYEKEQKVWLDSFNEEMKNIRISFLKSITNIAQPFSEGLTDEVIVFNPSGVTSSFPALVSLKSLNLPLTDFTSARFLNEGKIFHVPVDYVFSSELTGGVFSNYYKINVLDVPPFGFKRVKFSPESPSFPIYVTYYKNGSPVSKDSSFDELRVTTNFFSFTFKNEPFWSLHSLKDSYGLEYLDDFSFYPLRYLDDGGPWELGNEMEGCSLELLNYPSAGNIEVREGKSEVKVHINYEMPQFHILFLIYSNLDYFDIVLGGKTLEGTLVSLKVIMKGPINSVFSVPGAQLKRVSQKIFRPTFWPSSEWVGFEAPANSLLFLNRGIQSWNFEESGSIEGVILRNVSLEKCRLLTVPDFASSSPDYIDRFLRVKPVRGNIDPVDAWRRAIAFNSEILFPAFSSFSSLRDEGSFLTSGGDGVVSSFMMEGNTYRLRMFFPLFIEGRNRAEILFSEDIAISGVKNYLSSDAGRVSCKKRLCSIEAEEPIISVYLKKR